MWWECIPGFAIIAGSLWLGGKGVGAINRYQNGGRVCKNICSICTSSTIPQIEL